MLTTHKCLQTNQVLIYFLIQLPNTKSLVQMKMKQINAGEPSNPEHCKCRTRAGSLLIDQRVCPFLHFVCVCESGCVCLSKDLVLGTKAEWCMCNDFFISLQFKNYGRFVGLFYIYRRQAGPTVHRTTNNYTLFKIITQRDWNIMW